MKRKFAAFDIDGTLARSSLFLQIVHSLVDEEKIPKKAGDMLYEKLEHYRLRKHPLAFAEYSQLSVDILFENIKSLSISDYRKSVDLVIEKTSGYLYTYTRDLAKRLKSEGYFLIALSGSEQYAIEKFTKSLNFDLLVGETYKEKNGYFTGETEEVFHKKDIFLKKLVEEYNLSYEGSYAIGDSLADAKMLKLVECPIAFNPEERLFELSKQNGWKIVIERKNVIYQLESHNGSYLLA